MPTILVIDDETRLRQLLAQLLRLEKYHVLEADSASVGLHLLGQEEVAVVLSDVRLPDRSGIDLTRLIKERWPSTEIIVLTAYATIQDGVTAMKNGAFDYLMKGDDNDKIIPLVAKAVEKAALQVRVRQLEQQLTARLFQFSDILGQSPLIRQAVQLAEKVAPTPTTVLLTGETGTGKELFAQAIHTASPRRAQAFVAVNCGAFARDILESELFGHRTGAFTGATKDKKGLFEEANGGTLFLDEIGELSPELQSKLLRVLETGEFIRVGDTKTTRVNVRIVAATHRDLLRESQTGAFRSDLYYRLSVFQIALPALRDRLDDVPVLVESLAQGMARRMGKPIRHIEPQFWTQLRRQKWPGLAWPGNIRELRNVVERAVILSESGTLRADALPVALTDEAQEPTFLLADLEKRHIRNTLLHTQHNKTETARLLGIGLTTLYRKIEEYGL